MAHTTCNVRDRTASQADANALTTTYGYDANNNLTTLTDPRSNTRSWTYDVRNLMVTKTMPDPNDQCSYTYDALRRVTLVTRQDSTTIGYLYDLAGRLTDRTYSGQANDSFTYDPASRLTEAVKGRHNITVQRAYAADSTQLSETYLIDGRTYQLQRGYDDANRVTSQTYADGKVMTWAYNTRSLVTGATYDGTNVLTQSHDSGYRLTTQTFGNSLTRTITYNRQDNHRTRDEVATIPELRFDYTYAADKNILSEDTPAGVLDSLSFTATYDPGNRLSTWDRNTNLLNARQDQAWSYDGAGNWAATTIDGSTTSRTHSDSDELQTIGSNSLSFDPRGNLLSDDRTNDYEWDQDNRLIEADGSGYTKIEYRYDALGRRIVRKQGATDETVLLWWGQTEQSEHEHQTGQPVIQNDLQANPNPGALNTIFARVLDGDINDIQYFHKNYLDHVKTVTDDSGNILEHYRYTAFGEPEIYDSNGNTLNASAIDNDILWNVRRFEADTDLYMYHYRHYDAISGRWPSRDPIGEKGGINLYGMVGNDAVGKVDYLGLEMMKEDYDFVSIELTRIFFETIPDYRKESKNDWFADTGGGASTTPPGIGRAGTTPEGLCCVVLLNGGSTEIKIEQRLPKSNKGMESIVTENGIKEIHKHEDRRAKLFVSAGEIYEGLHFRFHIRSKKGDDPDKVCRGTWKKAEKVLQDWVDDSIAKAGAEFTRYMEEVSTQITNEIWVADPSGKVPHDSLREPVEVGEWDWKANRVRCKPFPSKMPN